MSQPVRPRLLVVFYANPDAYPPTFNAVSLLREHFEVRILCRKSECETRLWPTDVRLDRVGPGHTQTEARSASHLEKLSEFGAFVWAVRKALRQLRPSLVLAYEPHAFAALSLARCKAPIVYQRHEVEELDEHDTRTLGGRIGRYALDRSHKAAVMVFPEAQRAAYYARHTRLDADPIIVPNFPLVSSFPEPDFDARLAERASSRHLLYRGSFGPASGLLSAVRVLPVVHRNLGLRICGFGDSAFVAELTRLAIQLGVSERVDLAGYVPFDELNRQTQRASVGLMLYEPLGTNLKFLATAVNKLYEYPACGVPTLAPDRAEYRGLLANEAWVELVDPNTQSIAGGIERILSTPEGYAHRCRTARQRFLDRFNYEAVFGPMLARMLKLAKLSNEGPRSR